jgi:uncharacterized protein (TIRG00374 family)
MYPQKKSAAKKALLFLVKSAFAAILLYLLLRKTRYEDFARNFSAISWWWLVAAALLHITGYVVSAHRWRILLLAQGLRPSLWELIKSYIVATFFNYVLLGTVGGDIYRAYDTGVKSRKGAQAVSAVFVERVTGVAAMMFLAAMGIVLLLVGPTRVSVSVFRSVTTAIGVCAVIFLLLFAALLVLFNPRIVQVVAARLDRPVPLLGKVRKVFLSFHGAVTVYRSNLSPVYKNLFWALVLQVNVIVHWFLVGLAVGLPELRLHPMHHFCSYMIVIPAITLVLTVPVTPGGVGVREWIVWAFGTPLGFSEVASGKATAALMSWLQVATVLFYGMIGFLMFVHRFFSTKRSDRGLLQASHVESPNTDGQGRSQ